MPQAKLVGQSIRRKEDPRFLRGEGKFVDDIRLHGMAHAALLRSSHAHARLKVVDTRQAAALPDVLAVITFQDIASLAKPIPMRLEPHPSFQAYLQMPLAGEEVRYAGEPIAVVVATSRYAAEDALDCIEVDYAPLPAVVDVREALKRNAPRVHESTESNLAGSGTIDLGDVDTALRRADIKLSEQFAIQRHTGVPLETRGLVAQYDRGAGIITVWGPTKVPHFNRSILSSFLQIPEHRIHFIEPDVGGGFGVRGEFYPEDFLIPFLARSLGRPVKWIEDRREHLLATNHSRQQRWEIEVGATKDGMLLGVKAKIWNDMGAYIRTHGATVPSLAAAMFPGPYRIPNYHCEWNAVITNKTPTGTYRAPGRYECNFVRERLVDMIARRLNLDPAAVRARNLIPPDQMPYAVGTHVLNHPITFDSGDYPRLLQKAIEISGYCSFPAERDSARRTGKLLGMGLACFVEKSGTGPFETARVRLDKSGQAVVFTGVTSVGQGVETILAQICADELGLSLEDVAVIHGDTFLSPQGTGTFASRAAVMAGSATLLAARKVREKVMRLAAASFGCAESEVRWEAGMLSSSAAGGESREALSLRELITRTSGSWDLLVSGLDLEATHYFECREMTFPHGVQIARVEVDRETGVVSLQKLWSLYDIGRAINPALVEGQIRGGAAQGIGGALLEELEYSEDGQLLSASFMDYLLPSSMEVPPMEARVFQNDPSPLNPLGVKGGGEGGAAAVGAAVANAVSDALSGLGIEITSLPLKPGKLLEMISQAKNACENSSVA